MMHAALEPVYVYQAFASKWDALGDGARCQTAEQWDWFVRRVNDSDPARWPDAAAVFGASHSVEPFGSKLEFLMASLGATTPTCSSGVSASCTNRIPQVAGRGRQLR